MKSFTRNIKGYLVTFTPEPRMRGFGYTVQRTRIAVSQKNGQWLTGIGSIQTRRGNGRIEDTTDRITQDGQTVGVRGHDVIWLLQEAEKEGAIR